jgi:hypothetical protein
MKTGNLALRFLLEVTALVIFGCWGFSATDNTVAHILLCAGLPLAVAIFWGVFIAPRARIVLPTAARMTLGLVVFVCAAAALISRGEIALGVMFAGASVLNAVLMIVWRQDHIISRDAV